MGLEARLLLGHCSPRLSALSGPSRIGPTDHFEGIRASHIKGQTLVEMAGTHHRSLIMMPSWSNRLRINPWAALLVLVAAGVLVS